MADTKTFPEVIPDYKEPPTVEELARLVDHATLCAPLEARSVMYRLLGRLYRMETALLPFAVYGYYMGNERINQDGLGHPGVAVGGTWVGAGEGSQRHTNELDYRSAVDTLGRQRVLNKVTSAFEERCDGNIAMAERDDGNLTSH